MELSKWYGSKPYQNEDNSSKGVIAVTFKKDALENVKLHIDHDLFINGNLTYVDQLNYNFFEVQRSFHKLKSTIP